jgi:hypothetical protein
MYILEVDMMYSTKMRRLQIYLDPNSDNHLRRLAAKTGKSKAELIRTGINLLLVQESGQMNDSLLDLVGIAGKGGCPDAAEHHDQYLYVREDRAEPDQEKKDE